jgi:hypothetical protein
MNKVKLTDFFKSYVEPKDTCDIRTRIWSESLKEREFETMWRRKEISALLLSYFFKSQKISTETL